MGAMGLDFLFATDHASSSSQIVDADLPPVNKIPEIAHSHDDRLLESDVKFTTGILRDMNEERFAFCHDLIYGDRGVNNEASWRAGNFQFPQNYRSYGILPQIFLGGEVDAVPELSVSTVQANTVAGSDGKFKVSIPYGNGLRFDLGTLCTPQGCDDPRNLLDQVDGDTYLVRDFQGISSFEYFGREHMVYFPNSSNRIVGAETTFIPSYTSRFGGATRRLDSASVPSGNPIPPLLPEIERKGVAFVAHHLNASGGANGPGGPPWTDAMLLKAFRSPAVLGLEFWNENSRNRTPVCSHDFCANDNRFGGYEEGYQREETLKADSNNPLEAFVANVEYLFGFDPLPDKFHNIALPLEEVRRGFITGDSNGGLFELSVFDPLTGRWQEELHEIEHALHHGAYDWDMLNLRGLDFEKNQELPWLAPGEPRRMFMAGGSDAHGDLNYRRAGYFLGTDDANDAALGKPRNLVFVGNPLGSVVYSHGPVAEDPTRSGGADKRTGLSIRSAAAPTDGDEPTSVDPAPDSPVVQPDDPLNDPPMDGEPVADRPYVPPFSKIPVDDIRANLNGLEIRAHSQEQVVTALRRGQFCVTDGPIIRVAIDLNGNNQIDDSDLQMGGVHRLTYDDALNGLPSRSDTVTLLTEVVSTREFGPIMDIDVYVGAHPSPNHVNPSEPVEPRIYAPYFHGPGGFKDDAEHSPTTLYDSNGRTYYRQKDNYWRGESAGDNVTWNYTSGEPFSYTYTLVTTLHLNNYEVGKGVPADRFFVRAYAQTAPIDNPEPVSSRYAYSNPIWIIRQPSLIGLSHIAERGLKSPSSSANDALAPTLRAVRNAKGELVLHFTGTCMFSPRLGEPFKDIPGAVSPYVVPAEQRAGFFRVRR
jgi:hypothetical protein